MINLHFGTSNYLHRKSKYTSRKQYSLGLFFSGNAKKIHTDQNIIQVHLLCLKANDLQTLKISNCKKWFFSVYVIGTIYFNECWKILFLIKFVVTGSLQPPIFETSDLKEVRILFFISVITLQ